MDQHRNRARHGRQTRLWAFSESSLVLEDRGGRHGQGDWQSSYLGTQVSLARRDNAGCSVEDNPTSQLSGSQRSRAGRGRKRARTGGESTGCWASASRAGRAAAALVIADPCRGRTWNGRLGVCKSLTTRCANGQGLARQIRPRWDGNGVSSRGGTLCVLIFAWGYGIVGWYCTMQDNTIQRNVLLVIAAAVAACRRRWWREGQRKAGERAQDMNEQEQQIDRGAEGGRENKKHATTLGLVHGRVALASPTAQEPTRTTATHSRLPSV